MKLGKYEALDKQDIRDIFVDYIDAIEMPIIDYVAIGVQDTIHKTSTSMMSRLDWQKTFRSLQLADSDPVRKASFNTTAKMFAFDELDYQDSCGKEVMRQRRRHDIENGLVLMDRNLGCNFMLTLATGYKNFLPYRFFIDNNQAIDRIFQDLKKLVGPSTKAYQMRLTNHQGGDAK